MEILKCEGLTKTFGTGDACVHALKGVDFVISKGEFVAIVGTSGSGKSTLLHMPGGLDSPTKGTVTVGDKDIFSLKEEITVFRRRNIGFVFQAFNLIPILNVYENIVLPIQLDGKTAGEKYIDEIIETLGLNEKLNLFIQEKNNAVWEASL